MESPFNLMRAVQLEEASTLKELECNWLKNYHSTSDLVPILAKQFEYLRALKLLNSQYKNEIEEKKAIVKLNDLGQLPFFHLICNHYLND